MSENKQLRDGLLKAIKEEIEGHNFYMMAAKTTEDEQGKRVFEKLAQEEIEHVNFLKAQYKAFVETDNPDSTVKLALSSAISPEKSIFSDKIRARINNAHYEMTALSVGIQLELSAMKFYKGEADRATNPVVKDFFSELAQWEQGHYTILLNQQEALKDDYWTNNSFAPF